MRHLEQDSRTVTGIFFAAARPAVIEILQNRQRLLDDFMGFLTLDIDDESDATGIVLKPRIIKALFGRKVGNLHIRILRWIRPLLLVLQKDGCASRRTVARRGKQLGHIEKPILRQ